MGKRMGLLLVVLFLVSGCPGAPDFETRTLTDTQGDTTPAFVDVTSSAVSQMELWLIELSLSVADTIPLSPDVAYQNVVYKFWLDTDTSTTYPAHGGGNAEYVVSLWYNHLSGSWQGDIFDCSTSDLVPNSQFDVNVGGDTVSGRVDLAKVGNPAAIRYSYESFTDAEGHDGNANATMDEISLTYE